MAENKMGQVAEMFGKEFGEYFKIKNGGKDDKDDSVYSFESCGVVWWEHGKQTNTLIIVDWLLEDLLTGRAVIVDD